MIHAARRYAWLLSVGLLLIAAARPANLASAAEATAPETQPQRDARLKWWRDARFGMVIHWGPVSLVGTEISWSRGGERRGIGGKGEIPLEVYDNLYKRFDPAKFDAKVWVDLAKDAGMKYMVLTAKHCDGFCLWSTKAGDYHIGNSPFRRDVCGELAAARTRPACGSAGTTHPWTGATPTAAPNATPNTSPACKPTSASC